MPKQILFAFNTSIGIEWKKDEERIFYVNDPGFDSSDPIPYEFHEFISLIKLGPDNWSYNYLAGDPDDGGLGYVLPARALKLWKR